VLGLTDFDLFPKEVAAQCYADDMRVIRTGQPVLNREELLINHDGQQRWVLTSKLPLRDEKDQIVGLVGMGLDISERRRAERQLRQLFQAVEQSPDTVMITDPNGRIEYVNPKFCETTGYHADEVQGKNPRLLKSGINPPQFYSDLWRSISNGRQWHGELCNKKRSGELFWEAATISPIKGQTGDIAGFLAIKRDITEQKRADKERALMEVQLRQAQKLEAIGQLAAGIAHEINTPTQYVGDNTRFFQESFKSINPMLGMYQELLQGARNNTLTPETLARAEQILKDSDLPYLLEQIPTAINETLEGVERVTKIVRAMKEFSHPGNQQRANADLNRAIETTVTVARNEWKYVAEVKLDLDPALPMVPCYVGQFNQAILNLVINSSHAIADVVKQSPGAKGTITIRTRRDGDHVEVRVSDTGTGIPEAIRPRVFEPFFTTKDVGQGTGQGLTIVYSSVVKKHGGTIGFESEVGKGTTFILRLPLAPAPADSASANEKRPAGEMLPAATSA
jgi:PAS domain S-box-containing protein